MFVRRKDEGNDKTKIQGRKRGNAYNEHEKEYPRTKTQGLEAYHLSSVWAAVLGKRTGTTVLEKGQNPENTLYRMRVRREKMSSFTLIITGLITGFILGKAVPILHYAIKIKQEEEKKYDRDRKDTQSNEKGDSGLYPVSPERGAESSVSGISDNGESLDITKELALYSRNVLTQYCNSQSNCEKCCLEQNGGCSLISGPPCMWAKRTEEVIKY